MSARLSPATADGTTALQSFSRSAMVDAAARSITRRGDHRLRWAAIACEAGNLQGIDVAEWFDNLTSLIDECYARSAQGLNDSLLRAETAPGTALDKIAAFIVAALETRRARGVFLSFRRGADLPPHLRRRLNEHDTAVRVRLKRLLNSGRRDGSLALRNLDSAVELLLASLQVPTVVLDGPEQRMWDSELVELLLAALAEPHPPEADYCKRAFCKHCGSALPAAALPAAALPEAAVEAGVVSCAADPSPTSSRAFRPSTLHSPAVATSLERLDARAIGVPSD